MISKSWLVTIIPLIVYLLSFGYSVVTGDTFSVQQNEMLTNLFYGFLGAGAIGGSVAVANKFKSVEVKQ